VCRRTDQEIKAAEQGHAAIEAHQLHRDLTLVMVHREHRVKRAVFRARGKPYLRETALRSRYRRSPGLLHGGFNRVYFLAPEISAIAGVRIKAGDRYPRPARSRPRASNCP